MNVMIPKSRKISRKDFPQDFHKCFKYHSPSLFLLVKKQENNTMRSRFSVVVSKKVSKSAVSRVLLKRRAYNIIKAKVENIKPGFLCVFYFKKGSERLGFNDVEKEMVQLLNKAKITN